MESWELLCGKPKPANGSEHLPEFTYEPLASTQGCIRLIDILELSTDGTIIYTMKEKQFNINNGSYNALSYCWGLSRPLHRIIINNKVLYVRKHIWDLLRAIHVGQMHHIFSIASTIYAWIGNWDTRFGSAFQKLEEPNADSELALSFLPQRSCIKIDYIITCCPMF
ncbi:hypothetical protein COCSADRAFT_101677 [Bipolaris sorokiniana ND90Pr]|uniref:Heterokaryon incompatibility domain-containing protein n=1 Tax=Cochliobolus sativus (strain ND90Pr / ATCC 201652) TaxID=665912 RepID=M2SQ64_COCSN|nr:uncharacterized protein COCSADRAFT_101677 [Bipolaris sorokiniana ND90Pr]EMD59266.1 hypothetical protein COCSADRAFT_101677 [Bipolaris sorokiniana ND90Pr]